jgi:hypothetical protein
MAHDRLSLSLGARNSPYQLFLGKLFIPDLAPGKGERSAQHIIYGKFISGFSTILPASIVGIYFIL